MSLYIRDPGVDALATELQQRMGAKTKTEAVRTALERLNTQLKAQQKGSADLERAERIARIQARVVARMGPHRDLFDEKAFMDEMWES